MIVVPDGFPMRLVPADRQNRTITLSDWLKRKRAEKALLTPDGFEVVPDDFPPHLRSNRTITRTELNEKETKAFRAEHNDRSSNSSATSSGQQSWSRRARTTCSPR